MIQYHFTAVSMANSRFGYSPLLEVRNALRVLHPLSRAFFPAYDTWRRTAQGLVDGAGLDLRFLYALVPPANYVPDFLAPPAAPEPLAIEDELASVRATPLTRVRTELGLIEHWLAPGTDRRRVAEVRALRQRPGLVRDRAAAELLAFWELVLLPDWPRIRACLQADLDRRALDLALRGVAHAFGALNDGIRWRRDTLEVRRPFPVEVELNDEGLVLMPSVFAGNRLGGATDPPNPPTVWYRAYDVHQVWRTSAPVPDGLVRALGRTRARILARLHQPTPTTQVAADLDVAAGHVAEQLAVLRAAGLVQSQRSGRLVLNQRTPLGDDLVSATPGPR
ncbi:ArsR/SmtB family transcription factor [Tenggerimyces flavus]|uniref:ArsR/SmtB family transcription factor n=1 Tax=Tenggerimyces flavus TaxID=1708749 RepID=A0ABV7Y952_9ACTN|nr:winged helix-turn-helix domain-containing protein [Tenggerimyces flavus]MBM7785004.1 DNA-binding transcriptional ArsR family regulator [Tenggerimyces flavus]